LPLVRKSAFAVMRNVSNARVSQWLAEGKIDGEAIVGTGQRAMLDADLALAQLNLRLDTDQRYGVNGLSTNLDEPASREMTGFFSSLSEEQKEAAMAYRGEEGHGDPRLLSPRAIPAAEPDSTVEARLKAEKLKQAGFLTNKLELEDAARQGKYMETVEAAASMRRVADEMLKIFEGSFPEFSSAIAAKFQVPSREVTHLLHEEFRRIREQLAAVYTALAKKMPPTVEGG
jgi:hypothetical protein